MNGDRIHYIVDPSVHAAFITRHRQSVVCGYCSRFLSLNFIGLLSSWTLLRFLLVVPFVGLGWFLHSAQPEALEFEPWLPPICVAPLFAVLAPHSHGRPLFRLERWKSQLDFDYDCTQLNMQPVALVSMRHAVTRLRFKCQTFTVGVCSRIFA